MYAITGITGKVGGAVARVLLGAHRLSAPLYVMSKRAGSCGRPRDVRESSRPEWQDAASLTAAFTAAEGVFILPPSEFIRHRGFPRHEQSSPPSARPSNQRGLEESSACRRLARNQPDSNLLTQRTLTEAALGQLPMPIAFLRPAWFMENAAWDVASARQTGLIASFLQPLNKPVPMVATADVGRVAAELLQQNWTGRRVVELEGPSRITPRDVAAAFGKILGNVVRIRAIPRETWNGLFESQGMRHPLPRIQMLDGFNEGWIRLRGGRPGRFDERKYPTGDCAARACRSCRMRVATVRVCDNRFIGRNARC